MGSLQEPLERIIALPLLSTATQKVVEEQETPVKFPFEESFSATCHDPCVLDERILPLPSTAKQLNPDTHEIAVIGFELLSFDPWSMGVGYVHPAGPVGTAVVVVEGGGADVVVGGIVVGVTEAGGLARA